MMSQQWKLIFSFGTVKWLSNFPLCSGKTNMRISFSLCCFQHAAWLTMHSPYLKQLIWGNLRKAKLSYQTWMLKTKESKPMYRSVCHDCTAWVFLDHTLAWPLLPTFSSSTACQTLALELACETTHSLICTKTFWLCNSENEAGWKVILSMCSVCMVPWMYDLRVMVAVVCNLTSLIFGPALLNSLNNFE